MESSLGSQLKQYMLGQGFSLTIATNKLMRRYPMKKLEFTLLSKGEDSRSLLVSLLKCIAEGDVAKPHSHIFHIFRGSSYHLYIIYCMGVYPDVRA